MKKLIVLSLNDDYDVGGLVRYLIRMFEDESVKDIFENKFENSVNGSGRTISPPIPAAFQLDRSKSLSFLQRRTHNS